MDKNDDILMDGIDERIELFLRGEMSPEEETAFKQEIKSNPELRNRAMAMTSLIRGLQTKNAAREEAIIRESASKAKVSPVLWWACSIAAVFVIFFGIYNGNSEELTLVEIISSVLGKGIIIFLTVTVRLVRTLTIYTPRDRLEVMIHEVKR